MSGRPSRRGLFGASAALIAGAGALASAAPPSPAEGADAALIRLHQALPRLMAVVDQVVAQGRALSKMTRGSRTPATQASEAALADALADWWDVVDEIREIRATTAAGLRVKADVMRMVLEIVLCGDGETAADLNEDHDPPERFAWSLARDVLAGVS